MSRRIPGKQLGGESPRSRWRRLPRREKERRSSFLLVLAVALFVLGGVAGFGWAADRQLRGGLLRQRAEAMQRPDWVALEELPPYVPQVFVAVVEPDFLRRGPALRGGEESNAIARELVRQVHMIPESLGGRARTLVMAPVLEQRTRKREVLELYLNRVYLGRTQGYPVYGIYHAAAEYFGKEPAALTLSETATLAGVLLPPRIQDPEEQPGAVGVRRNEVLRVLRLGGLITEQEYEQALQEPLEFQPGLEVQPATRPAGWPTEPEPIRLPPALRSSPEPDSAPAG